MDADGDGAAACEDCDDSDPAISPSAVEICDALDVDEDCDGLSDDADPSVDPDTQHVIWTDSDGDGYGEDRTVVISCEGEGAAQGGDCNDADAAFYPGAPETDCADPNDYNCDGFSGANDNDSDGFFACQECNDGDAAINPGAAEVCNGVDDDCDGAVDDGLILSWYPDTDGDGWGDGSGAVQDCAQPAGYVLDGTDCDDADPLVNPAGAEVCDGVDQDCDGLIDDDAADATLWYADADLDGYGDPAAPVYACALSVGISASADDCDDADSAVNPGAAEICDGLDNDCDGTIDTGVGVGYTWYADADGDGFGDNTLTTVTCATPGGYVQTGGDCDDTDAAYNPGAVESDCTDPNDYNCDGATGYSDTDGDGWIACEDCDDTDAAVSPAAAESCNSIDDDCDGAVDEAGALGEVDWYRDGDGDGFGDAAQPFSSCGAPLGYVGDDTDCDDGDAAIYPAAPEHCDGVDENCDGVIDESPVDALTWYADADLDGYGDPDAALAACSAPAGYLADATDCDDADPAINPRSLEYCDGIDNDCNGAVDDNVVDPAPWYPDGDGDGWGDGAAILICGPAAGYADRDGDCDDADPAYNPGVAESCTDVNDYNCDGSAGADDADGDGYRSCEECDDGDAAVNPAAPESCNGYDDDCDGDIDEAGSLGETVWYVDADADGYGGAGTMSACDRPAGYVATSTDCDDGLGTVYPGASESCNGIDDDCDGDIDEAGAIDEIAWYIDTDGDGFGDEATAVYACDAPAGYTGTGGDCDDTSAFIYPGATDLCDSTDNDCDGSFDEGGFCPCPVTTYNGHPYMFCTAGVNWNDAEVACEAWPGYTLAAPATAAENDWLSASVISISATRWWAGGADSTVEGRWQWMTLEPWSYSNFAAGEGSSNSQDCLQLGNPDWTWTDASCRSNANYVCEGTP